MQAARIYGSFLSGRNFFRSGIRAYRLFFLAADRRGMKTGIFS